MVIMSSILRKKLKKYPPAFLQEGILAPRVPYLNDIAHSAGSFILLGSFFEGHSGDESYISFKVIGDPYVIYA